MYVLDTTFLLDLLKNKQECVDFLRKHEEVLTTQINMFEAIRGFFLRPETKHLLMECKDFFENIKVVHLDDMSIIRSSEISAEMIKKGTMLEDSDCLIAGICLANGLSKIVTKNKKHFERIKGIKVIEY